jgi:hypothetical protein
LLALLSLVAAPAVTSTRFFCRYTGEEITGCAQAETPTQAILAADDCCDQRTFRAIDGARRVEEQRQQSPTPVAVGTAPVFVADVLAPAAIEHPWRSAPSAGPPAFICHRALLI